MYGAIGVGALAAAYLLFLAFGSHRAAQDQGVASPASNPVNTDDVGGTAQGPSEEEPHYFATGPDTRG